MGTFAQSHAESPLPEPTGFVNDYANVIDPATKSALEARLTALRDSTNPQIEIGVVTVRTTGDQPIFDYSLSVARGWKIGSKQDDNPGLLLVVAIDDRKYFTQVSRDAEGDIPDGLAGQIQRQNLVPAFKAGQYGKGIQDTVEAYIRRFGESRGFDPATLQKTERGSAPVGGPTRERGNSNLLVCVACGCIIGVIIIVFLVSGVAGIGGAAARRSSWNGGSFGGSGKRGRRDDGVDASDFIVPAIIGSLLSGGGSSSSDSSSSDWGSSGGSDWGGFGGGGDFGGGGAGGDW